MLTSPLTFAATWIHSNPLLAALAVFAWGLVSVVFSPCHLAAIPVMAAHSAGYTRAQGENTAPDGAVALSFAGGYFIAIAGIGILCAALGRMVDIELEHFWMFPVGVLLVWLGISLWREHTCPVAIRLPQTLSRRLGLGARSGGVALGVVYGVLSCGCTLAFLAPVIVLSLPHGVLTGAVMAVSFGLGHCLPMALVGLIGPLGRRLLTVCRLPAPANSLDRNHHHTPGHNAHEPSHHVMERIFRKIVAVAVCLGGFVLLAHGLLE